MKDLTGYFVGGFLISAIFFGLSFAYRTSGPVKENPPPVQMGAMQLKAFPVSLLQREKDLQEKLIEAEMRYEILRSEHLKLLLERGVDEGKDERLPAQMLPLN